MNKEKAPEYFRPLMTFLNALVVADAILGKNHAPSLIHQSLLWSSQNAESFGSLSASMLIFGSP